MVFGIFENFYNNLLEIYLIKAIFISINIGIKTNLPVIVHTTEQSILSIYYNNL